MTKKDPDNKLDSISENENANEAPVKQRTTAETKEGKTDVKNAHASGNGSIGRSDEDLTKDEPSSGDPHF